MKIILICIFSVILSVDLFARMNPFEATDTFMEKKEQLIKEQEAEKNRLETMVMEPKISENIIIKEIEDKKVIEEIVVKKEIIEEKVPEVKVKKQSPNPLNKVMIEDEEFAILPFVNIYTVQNTLMIEVDKKYNLIHQEVLEKQKKFLFDFQGKKSFYTVRKNIKNKNYKSLAVGTHLKEKYFRVVIDFPFDTSMYRKSIDTKNGIIAIQRRRK